MEFLKKPKWKRILLAVVCFLALAVLASGSYAAYNSLAFQRGVVRNGNGETIRFTSNYLQTCASGSTDYAGRTILYDKSLKKDDPISFDIYIYNYANGNPSLSSDRDITYTLQLNFENGNGNNYKVNDETVNNNTYTISNQVLRGRKDNYFKYTISFPGTDLDKLKIVAIATPTNLSVTNEQILAAVITPCTGSTINSFSWAGKFIDATSGIDPAFYDGFNYEVSISSGVADATLTWNTGTVEIDKFFLINLGKTENEIKKILDDGILTFEMNQPEGTGDYLIPFYIKKKSNLLDEDSNSVKWAEMSNNITFTAKEKGNGSVTVTPTPIATQ